MARSLKEQAAAVIRSKTQIGSDKKTSGNTPGNYQIIKSVRSANDTALALAKIATDMGVKRIKHITPEMAANYLKDRAENFLSQKSLERDRKALSIAIGIELPRVKAISEKEIRSRSYSNKQVGWVMEKMTERNSLSVEIAYKAGLRAHELLTLKRIDEGNKSSSRSWSNERFVGKDGVKYLVTGKGGLTREVNLPHYLAEKLENRRHPQPVVKRDRGVNYVTRYDIGAGNALSASFNRASNRALGFSKGLHGVRHSYAQERLDEIKMVLRVGHKKAREVLSQELGHFRGDVAEVYLR